MKLQDFLGKDEKWGFEAIAKDADLALQVQSKRIQHFLYRGYK
ncbi:hypothetical protein [Nostoc sp.]